MITIKHFMDKVEPEDGNRIWVEPIGLTCDLKKWCHVNHTLCHVAPPRELWDWFMEHPDGYTYFRGRYHEWLNKSSYRPACSNWRARRCERISRFCISQRITNTIRRRRCMSSCRSWRRIARRIILRIEMGISAGSKLPGPW